MARSGLTTLELCLLTRIFYRKKKSLKLEYRAFLLCVFLGRSCEHKPEPGLKLSDVAHLHTFLTGLIKISHHLM